MRKIGKTLQEVDSLESSIRLLAGFVGALLVAVVGKFFEGSRDEIWLTMLLALQVVTSWGAVIPPAACNGLISGLFYNFFFLSSGGKLSFQSAGEWWLELVFIGVGVAAAVIGRLLRRDAAISHSASDTDKTDTERPYQWDRHVSRRESNRFRRNSWTL